MLHFYQCTLISTGNNIPCNFQPNEPVDEGWNLQGTGEFSLFDCRVTSAIKLDGKQPIEDAVINSAVLNNIDEPYAKIVDFDVQLMISSVFGLTIAVIGVDGKVLVQGSITTFVLGQDLWERNIHIKNYTVSTETKCYLPDYCLSAKSVSTISNVKWGNISMSPTLQELKEASDQRGGRLSISMTVYSYVTKFPGKEINNETLGQLIGTIGPPSLNEPVERILSYEGVPRSTFYNTSLLNEPGQNALMYNAPFQINHNSSRLSVDFSNSISLSVDGNFVFLGELRLGVQDRNSSCIHLIGESISYLDTDWVDKGCIHDHVLSKNDSNRLLSSPLYVFRVQRGNDLSLGPALLHSCLHVNTFLQPLLQETPKFVRPIGNYLGKLEYGQTMKVELKVSQYGLPLVDQNVHVAESSFSVPFGGIIPIPQISATNKQGIATVIFHAAHKIPKLRKFSNSQQPCDRLELPIEGQLYIFKYFLTDVSSSDAFEYDNIFQATNMIAILAFSCFKEPKHPNWMEHVQPIFQVYERLFPVMKHIVNLGSYTDVTSTKNLHLIDYAMRLDNNHPNHMPVTRDLSPSKRSMILKWLRQKPKPVYSAVQNDLNHAFRENISNTCVLNINISDVHETPKLIFLPQRCLNCQYEIEPRDIYFQQLYKQTYFPDTFITDHRPLIRIGVMAQFEYCTLHALREQLQTAIELEFYTIPVYLTSLYSIVDGCNGQIRQLIHNVVMQEMQHLTHAANILIAIGGRPVIDSSDIAPSYPAKGLPGGVLPNLVINLERFSMEHVYRVFMGIEVPHNVSVDTESPIIFNNTIGQFYKEISDCIDFLGDDIFIPSEAHEQIVWPWFDPSISGADTVHIVTNTTTAKRVISSIIEQGEGASPTEPSAKHISTSEHNMSHFYKIVCKRHLVKNHDTYCYSGSLIPFDPLGVWPMQSNPSKDKIRPNTNCYTQAKAFHRVYRALLRKIQQVFDGRREGLKEAIALMESLGLHARLVMQTRLQNHKDTTCGPVWDYDWD